MYIIIDYNINNDLDGCYIVFDTKNRNMELDTLFSNTKCIFPNIWKYAKIILYFCKVYIKQYNT